MTSRAFAPGRRGRGSFAVRLAAGLVLVWFATGRSSPALAEATPMDWSSVVQKVLPAVVNISVETLYQDPETGEVHRRRDLGTGFFISDNGLIVTNRHVIQGAFHIIVTTGDKRQWVAKLLAAGKFVDLAVLKVDTGAPMPFLKFAPDNAVHVGDPLLVFGNPLGLGTSVSAGIVSALNRDLMNTPLDDYIQTDAAINHGNSGGPVIDRNGTVAGVATILVTEAAGQGSSGLGFAIPSRDAAQAVRHLLDPQATPVGWIGVHLQDLSPNLARSFGLPDPRGVMITKVNPGSPAEAAGLQSGDVILRYRGSVPTDSSALMWEIVVSPVGQAQPITIERQGTTMDRSVMIADWPDLHMPISELVTSPALANAAQAPDLGLILGSLTAAARRLYNITAKQGVVVAGVDPASQAYAEGVRAGDVIEKVQDTPVSTADDVLKRVESAEQQQKFVSFLMARNGSNQWIVIYAGHGHSAFAGPGPIVSSDANGYSP